MNPAELIEKDLRDKMRVCAGVSMSGAEAEDAARIAVDALAGAGLVVVPANAHAWLVRVAEYVSMGRRYVDVEPYPDAIARLALGALPERTPDA